METYQLPMQVNTKSLDRSPDYLECIGTTQNKYFSVSACYRSKLAKSMIVCYRITLFSLDRFKHLLKVARNCNRLVKYCLKVHQTMFIIMSASLFSSCCQDRNELAQESRASSWASSVLSSSMSFLILYRFIGRPSL